MGDRGAAGPSYPVLAGFTSQKDDEVSTARGFSPHLINRRDTDDSAELQMLCHVGRVVNLFDEGGGHTDLVAV